MLAITSAFIVVVGGVEADYVTNRLKENGDEEKKERGATERERGGGRNGR